jgi:flagellar basal body-associated protein FliL
MIGSTMNLLAIIIIVLAVAAAGGIIYAAWELSSDKPAARTGQSGKTETPENTGNDRFDEHLERRQNGDKDR